MNGKNQAGGPSGAPADRVQEAVKNTNIPQLYCNGFALQASGLDTLMVLERNGLPVATLNMSFSSAKTLAQKLNELIDAIEKRTGRSIMTDEEIVRAPKPGNEK